MKKQIAILTTSLLILNGCGYVPAIGQYLKTERTGSSHRVRSDTRRS